MIPDNARAGAEVAWAVLSESIKSAEKNARYRVSIDIRDARTIESLLRPATETAKAGEAGVRKILEYIEKEAVTANDVIRLNRDGRGQGRIRVATAMHRIAKQAAKALVLATPSPAPAVAGPASGEATAAAIKGWPIEEFREWAANGTTYPNSYEIDVKRTWEQANRVLAAIRQGQNGGEG